MHAPHAALPLPRYRFVFRVAVCGAGCRMRAPLPGSAWRGALGRALSAAATA
jgi:hypothetical protein